VVGQKCCYCWNRWWPRNDKNSMLYIVYSTTTDDAGFFKLSCNYLTKAGSFTTI